MLTAVCREVLKNRTDLSKRVWLPIRSLPNVYRLETREIDVRARSELLQQRHAWDPALPGVASGRQGIRNESELFRDKVFNPCGFKGRTNPRLFGVCLSFDRALQSCNIKPM